MNDGEEMLSEINFESYDVEWKFHPQEMLIDEVDYCVVYLSRVNKEVVEAKTKELPT